MRSKRNKADVGHVVGNQVLLRAPLQIKVWLVEPEFHSRSLVQTYCKYLIKYRYYDKSRGMSRPNILGHNLFLTIAFPPCRGQLSPSRSILWGMSNILNDQWTLPLCRCLILELDTHYIFSRIMCAMHNVAPLHQ